ncbi:hypothetical protein [Bacillus sp. Marseille-P3661]|uniref:hypothetical protein n=1 Tax=Bacillus sp. Marseille-P3661 TaxID=1936234 RepID=UPI00115952DA|nr:hypothetical protein [Bacillus sp. Marseille-P3661]
MKKYVALFLAVTVLIYYSILFIDQTHHNRLRAFQESELQNRALSEVSFSVDDNGKKKIANSIPLTIFFNVVILTYLLYRLDSSNRRHIVLTPVFYQSNYVISPLFV